MMDKKARPNHRIYIQTLRQLTPEARLVKSFELTQMTRDLFMRGLHRRFPKLPEAAIKKIYLERLDKCHNRNY